MPLRGASGPGVRARATTSSPPTCWTAKRGTPSPITSSERSVTRRTNELNSTRTRSGAARPPAPVKTISSPACTRRSTVAPDSRSFGPCRSNIRPSGRPARAPAARTSAARRRRSSASPCEQFRRAQSRPAATSWSSTPGASVAGPSVATIFVRRSSMSRSVPSRPPRGAGRGGRRPRGERSYRERRWRAPTARIGNLISRACAKPGSTRGRRGCWRAWRARVRACSCSGSRSSATSAGRCSRPRASGSRGSRASPTRFAR